MSVHVRVEGAGIPDRPDLPPNRRSQAAVPRCQLAPSHPLAAPPLPTRLAPARLQFAKVGTALVEGKTARAAAAAGDGAEAMSYEAVTVSTEGGLEGVAEGVGPDDWTVRPQAFKTLVGRGHPEFSSSRQQVGPPGRRV